MTYVILYRSPIGVFAAREGTSKALIEFTDRDSAITYAEEEFSSEVPVQIVELTEL